MSACADPRPPGSGVRTDATTSALPMSTPAHRSTSRSTIAPFLVGCRRVRRGQPINDAMKRARDNNSRCREDPWLQSVKRARPHQVRTSSSRTRHDSHPSRRPQAMGVCEAPASRAHRTIHARRRSRRNVRCQRRVTLREARRRARLRCPQAGDSGRASSRTRAAIQTLVSRWPAQRQVRCGSSGRSCRCEFLGGA